MYASRVVLHVCVLNYVEAPTSPRISSPLARSVTVPANHPHARKQSLLDGQVQIQSSAPSPLMSNASVSTFSLTLDPIAEGATSPMPPETPAASSPFIEHVQLPPPMIASVSAPSGIGGGPAHRDSALPPHKSVIGLGRGPPPITVRTPQPRAHSSSFAGPNVELILYAYAQLSGTLSLSPVEDVPLTAEQLQTLQALRRSLLTTKAVGGGSMDITSRSPQTYVPSSHLSTTARRVNHARSTSLTSGLLSLLPPVPTIATSPIASALHQPKRPSQHRRTSSLLPSFFATSTNSTSPAGLGFASAPSQEDDLDSDAPLPTFEVQPTMLIVDLALNPGESRSCT